MKNYETKEIRNVVLMGQGGGGKTSVAEAMLYLSKTTDRLGRIAEGNTVSDNDPEEIRRQATISASLLSFEWKGNKINLIDTPGFYDFEGEVIEGMRSADAALIVVSGKSGIGVGTDKAVRLTKGINIPKAFFINKLDRPSADFYKVYNSLKDKYGSHICAFEIPVMKNEEFVGVLNIIDMKARTINASGERVEIEIPSELLEIANGYREELNEMLGSTCEELMNKYFDGVPFTTEDTKRGLYMGILAGDIVPVMCGSAFNCYGIGAAMDSISEFFPMPGSALVEKGTDENGDKQEVSVSSDEPTCALVFKTIADPFIGKVSFLKVISGKLTADSVLINARTHQSEKMGHLSFVCGKKQTEAKIVNAGDMAVVTKLISTKTGDTLCDPSRVVSVKGMSFPSPSIRMAIYPVTKGEEEKISAGLHRLMEEDLTFTLTNNTETHEHIIAGLGEMHIDVLVSKLQNRFATKVILQEPITPYREAIKKKIVAEGKHKKQSGGHGQFGHVFIEFAPNDNIELVFEEKVVGGSVPKNYFPAVEKGLQDCVLKGVLAGYPVVNLKATLLDGSYHPVDSSEMAFKMAATNAYKEGLLNANPVILEPICEITVSVPDDLMGDVIGDINKRRGQVLGMMPFDEIEGYSAVSAEVPMSEIGRYAIDLRSISHGSGQFTEKFLRYQEAPANVAEKIINHSLAIGRI
ncbi:MAG: elongation factor G [Clostridia bacterium]